MAGYSGYSMSNNAVDAYENGEKPISRWTKTEIIKAVEEQITNGDLKLGFDIDVLKKCPARVLKELCLSWSSWHHTSSRYNQTDFYSVDVDWMEELTEDEILRRIDARKENKKKEPEPETWECEFLIWSGTRNHPKATEVREIGTIKGNWFYRADGSKKKTTANGFRKIRRVQE